MSVRLVIFDMAGTTVSDNNNVAKAFRDAFKENGIDIELEDANPLMGYHKPLAIQMLLESRGIAFDAEFIEKIHNDFENEMLDFYEYAADVKPVKGAEDVFELLKGRGMRIALNTGFSKSIADTIVQRFQWKEKNGLEMLDSKSNNSYAIHLSLYVCHANSTSWGKNHQQGKPNTHQSIIYHGVRIKTTTDNLTTKFAP